MTSRLHAGIGIWRARHPRSAADRVYFVYVLVLVGLASVAPVARLVWLGTTSPTGLALLTAALAPLVAEALIIALWCVALLAGRARGPAVLPPFLTYAVGTSDLPRRSALRAPVVRAGAVVTVLTTLIAAIIAGSLLAGGQTTVTHLVLFTIVGLAAGVITTALWLMGQAIPRVAAPVAAVLVALFAVRLLLPQLLPFTPWGWTALLYPTASDSAPDAIIIAVVLTIAALASVPVLLDRIRFETLSAQAARWDTAAVHAAGMDFNSAASVYTARPRTGRRLRAVRSGRMLWLTFLRRSAVGALRTPGRLVSGIIGLALAGALVTCAFLPGVNGWMLGVTAGLVVFMAVGPLSDGIRHAAQVASDLPLYGVGDARLLGLHVQFPLLVSLVVPTAASLLAAVLLGVPTPSAVAAAALGGLGVLGRLDSALKGPMPPELLTPIPTPVGDLGALVRLVWALDGALLAALSGVAVVLVFSNPLLLLVLAGLQAIIGIGRWRRRR